MKGCRASQTCVEVRITWGVLLNAAFALVGAIEAHDSVSVQPPVMPVLLGEGRPLDGEGVGQRAGCGFLRKAGQGLGGCLTAREERHGVLQAVVLVSSLSAFPVHQHHQCEMSGLHLPEVLIEVVLGVPFSKALQVTLMGSESWKPLLGSSLTHVGW